MTTLPDPQALTRDELTSLLRELTSREPAVSDQRRTLHTQIDALRQALVDRIRDEGNTVIFGPDFLGPGPAGVREPRQPAPESSSDGIALPEPIETEVEADTPAPPEVPNS